jgi:DNA-binding NtrC family response regulator
MARTRALKTRKTSKIGKPARNGSTVKGATSPRGGSTRGGSARGSSAGAVSSRAASSRAVSRGAARGTGNHNETQLRKELDELYRQLIASSRPWTLRRARHEFERSYVEYVIRQNAGDRQTAAERLDIGFSTLKEKIRKP